MRQPACNRGDLRLNLSIDRTWSGDVLAAHQRPVLQLSHDNHLCVTAPLIGSQPLHEPQGPLDGLWEHEVLELFIGSPTHYLEVELGPWGHYLVLRFTDIRRPFACGLAAQTHWIHREGWWGASIRLDPSWLPQPPWRAIACWLHGPHNARHAALSATLPGNQPDFHQPHVWPYDLHNIEGCCVDIITKLRHTLRSLR